MNFLGAIMGTRAFSIVMKVIIAASIAAIIIMVAKMVLDNQQELGQEIERSKSNAEAVKIEKRVRDAGNVARSTPTVGKLRDGSF